MRILLRRLLQNRTNISLAFLGFCAIVLAITLGSGLAGRSGSETALGLPTLWTATLYLAPAILWVGARIAWKLLDRIPK